MSWFWLFLERCYCWVHFRCIHYSNIFIAVISGHSIAKSVELSLEDIDNDVNKQWNELEKGKEKINFSLAFKLDFGYNKMVL